MGPDGDRAGRDSVERRSADDSAPDELVQSVQALVQRYCRARLSGYPGGAEAAEDVAREVSRTAVDALRSTEDRGAPLAAAVFSIASHQVAEAQRLLERPSTGGEPSSPA